MKASIFPLVGLGVIRQGRIGLLLILLMTVGSPVQAEQQSSPSPLDPEQWLSQTDCPAVKSRRATMPDAPLAERLDLAGLDVEKGNCGPVNDALVLALYTRAVALGGADLQRAIAQRYALGQGVSRNYLLAGYWLRPHADMSTEGLTQQRIFAGYLFAVIEESMPRLLRWMASNLKGALPLKIDGWSRDPIEQWRFSTEAGADSYQRRMTADVQSLILSIAKNLPRPVFGPEPPAQISQTYVLHQPGPQREFEQSPGSSWGRPVGLPVSSPR